MKLRKLFYKMVYEPLYSILYSFKELWNDFTNLLSEFKKPRTWSAILYIACFWSFYTQDLQLFRWLVPLIIIVYWIRQKKDGAYRREMKLNALKHKNKDILEEFYDSYQREAKFLKTNIMDFDEWIDSERRKQKIDK